MKNSLALCLCLLLMFPLFAFAAGPDPKVILDAERAFAKATAERGVDGWMEFMAPNAVELGNPPTVGADQIRASMAKSFQDPGFKLAWEPTKAEFLGDGNMAYATGRYTLHFTGKDGKIVTQTGNYLTTWQKQKDGSWKVISDVGNADAAPASTAGH